MKPTQSLPTAYLYHEFSFSFGVVFTRQSHILRSYGTQNPPVKLLLIENTCTLYAEMYYRQRHRPAPSTVRRFTISSRAAAELHNYYYIYIFLISHKNITEDFSLMGAVVTTYNITRLLINSWGIICSLILNDQFP